MRYPLGRSGRNGHPVRRPRPHRSMEQQVQSAGSIPGNNDMTDRAGGAGDLVECRLTLLQKSQKARPCSKRSWKRSPGERSRILGRTGRPNNLRESRWLEADKHAYAVLGQCTGWTPGRPGAPKSQSSGAVAIMREELVEEATSGAALIGRDGGHVRSGRAVSSPRRSDMIHIKVLYVAVP